MPDDFEIEWGKRLESVLIYLGMDKSVETSGKSEKQLLRYCAGAEPPFRVLQLLTKAAGATLDWLTYGEVGNDIDFLLEESVYEREAQKLRRAIKRTKDQDEQALLGEQLARAEALLLHLRAERAAIEKDEPEFPPALQTVSSPGGSEILTDVGGMTDVVEQVAELVVSIYGDSGVRMPDPALAREVARRIAQLYQKAENPNDNEELDSLLPWLRSQIRKDIQAARDNPGTGKRSAS